MRTLRPPAMWSEPDESWTWIAGRLTPFGNDVTSVVPGGFAAYARILHPVQGPTHGNQLVRWSHVARWSGLELRPAAQFHSIALPFVHPRTPPPWMATGPTSVASTFPTPKCSQRSCGA